MRVPQNVRLLFGGAFWGSPSLLPSTEATGADRAVGLNQIANAQRSDENQEEKTAMLQGPEGRAIIAQGEALGRRDGCFRPRIHEPTSAKAGQVWGSRPLDVQALRVHRLDRRL